MQERKADERGDDRLQAHEDLQGDQAVVSEIAGEMDRGHAAAAELALEHVAVTESICELLGDRRRGAA